MPKKKQKSVENWIADAIKKKGSLRKSLGAKRGKPIPAGKLNEAAKQKGTTGKRARLAQTLRKLNKSRRKKGR